MSSTVLAVLAAVALLVGVLIGCIGVGGVLLVPALVYIGGIDIHVAIASCMVSYIFSGAAGAFAYARAGSIRWKPGLALIAGAMPGAFAGAAAVALVPGRTLEFLIAALVLFAGFNALRGPASSTGRREELRTPALVFIGLVTGVGSAMSGTGGPLVLVPILVWLGLPVLAAVGLSQVIQLPLATLATLGNLRYGEVDLALGLGIAVLLMAGVTLGARLAHRLSAVHLRMVVAWALVLVGVFVLVRATWASLTGA